VTQTKDEDLLQEAEALFQAKVQHVKFALRMALREGRTLKDISAIAFVGVSTMQNLLNGVTKRPTAWTTERIMYALGWRIAYLPADMPPLEAELRYEPPKLVRNAA